MQVILLERVEKLGQMGDIVTVKNGFARNFLLPQKKALRATEANKQYFESQRKEIEAANLAAKKEAEGVAKKLEGMKIVLVRQAGESGQLYGSVAARDIVLKMADHDVNIQRGQIVLNAPIKEIGVYEIAIKLHAEVSANISVNVARSEEEADAQFEKSADQVFESDQAKEEAAAVLSSSDAEEESATPAEEAVAEDATEAAEAEEAAAEDTSDENKDA